MKKSELKEIIREVIVKEFFSFLNKNKKNNNDHSITIPRWQGKEDVEFTSINPPYVSPDSVTFIIKKDGVDQIIYYNKVQGDTSARVFSGNNSTPVKLDQDEADRIRRRYFNY